MSIINSVLGPLDTADMGFTLSHEHIRTGSAGIQTTYPEFIDRQGTIDRGVVDLTEAYGEESLAQFESRKLLHGIG